MGYDMQLSINSEKQCIFNEHSSYWIPDIAQKVDSFDGLKNVQN